MKTVSLADISYSQGLALLALRKQAIDEGKVSRLTENDLRSTYRLQDYAEKHAFDMSSISEGFGKLKDNIANSDFGKTVGQGYKDLQNSQFGQTVGNAFKDPITRTALGGAALGGFGGLFTDNKNRLRNALMGSVAGGALGGGIGLAGSYAKDPDSFLNKIPGLGPQKDTNLHLLSKIKADSDVKVRDVTDPAVLAGGGALGTYGLNKVMDTPPNLEAARSNFTRQVSDATKPEGFEAVFKDAPSSVSVKPNEFNSTFNKVRGQGPGAFKTEMRRLLSSKGMADDAITNLFKKPGIANDIDSLFNTKGVSSQAWKNIGTDVAESVLGTPGARAVGQGSRRAALSRLAKNPRLLTLFPMLAGGGLAYGQYASDSARRAAAEKLIKNLKPAKVR